jgi:hypothetical protein
VKLTRQYLEPGAAVNYIQVSHRRTAIEYALAGVQGLHDANLDLLGRDPLNERLEGAMKAWVIECLLQGAYVREYHLWEKDCKAYFALMSKRSSSLNLAVKPKRGQTFTDLIREILSAFEVTLADEILSAIERMRQRVNVMKHDAGLELNHFITEADYTQAVIALESFWNSLSNCEDVKYGN